MGAILSAKFGVMSYTALDTCNKHGETQVSFESHGTWAGQIEGGISWEHLGMVALELGCGCFHFV